MASGVSSALGAGLASGLFSGLGSGLGTLGVSRPIGVGRSSGGGIGRGAGRITRGGVLGTVGGVVGVVVVGAGCVGPGLDPLPGRPPGGSGVVLDVAGGGVPAAGGLRGTDAAAAGAGAFFDPCALGLRRE